MWRPSSVTARAVPLFVPLLAAYPILYLANANQGQVTWATTALATLVAVVVALVAHGLLRLVGQSAASAGVAVVLLVVMFFGYGQVSSGIDTLATSLRLGGNEAPNPLDAAPRVRLAIAVAWGLLALALAWVVARSRWAGSVQLSKALTFAGGALVLLNFVMPAIGMARSAGGSNAAAPVARPASSSTRAPAGSPDIYFIVLDGYARADVLDRYYGFPNSSFVNGLRDRGFQVSDRSSANYNWTFLSLSSTLNMDYMHNVLAGKFIQNNQDRTAAYESIRNSATAAFLRDRGYRIVHLQSTWGATSVNPYADEQVKCEHSLYSNEFVRAIAEASWLGAFHSKAGVDLAQCHLANFESLSHMGGEPGPKFVLAHFLLPHHPYLFDRDGNILRNASISNQFEFQKRLWEDRDAYRSQLEFVNRKVLAAIDAIKAGSRQPPIILLESDHGPNLSQGLKRDEHVGLRLANLGAYHLPGAPAGLIGPDGSAVNQFRAILSYYFDANLEPLPDRHFFSPYGTPYQMVELPRAKLLALWRTSLDSPVMQSASVDNQPTNPQYQGRSR